MSDNDPAPASAPEAPAPIEPPPPPPSLPPPDPQLMDTEFKGLTDEHLQRRIIERKG